VIKYKYVLGTIAVAWPAVWGWWAWYWKERKVKLSVSGYRVNFKRDKAEIIQGVDVEFIIYNYDERPLGIVEGGIVTNYDRHLFVEIYMGDEPVMVLPQQTIVFKNDLNRKGEKVKKVCFYLADNREFIIKGQLVKKLNQHLASIGTKQDEMSLRAKKY
jgi:hypothetical protein